MYRIRKEFKFEAAHQLTKVPKDHKCSRLHGHSYRVEIFVSADELDDRGFVMDFSELSFLKHYIDNKLDHRNLNNLFNFETTAENLAEHLFDFCASQLNLIEPLDRSIFLESIRVWETATAYAEYFPGTIGE